MRVCEYFINSIYTYIYIKLDCIATGNVFDVNASLRNSSWKDERFYFIQESSLRDRFVIEIPEYIRETHLKNRFQNSEQTQNKKIKNKSLFIKLKVFKLNKEFILNEMKQRQNKIIVWQKQNLNSHTIQIIYI